MAEVILHHTPAIIKNKSNVISRMMEITTISYQFKRCGFLYRLIGVYRISSILSVECTSEKIATFKTMNEAKLYVNLLK
jgi:hypothetical protein